MSCVVEYEKQHISEHGKGPLMGVLLAGIHRGMDNKAPEQDLLCNHSGSVSCIPFYRILHFTVFALLVILVAERLLWLKGNP